MSINPQSFSFTTFESLQLHAKKKKKYVEWNLILRQDPSMPPIDGRYFKVRPFSTRTEFQSRSGLTKAHFYGHNYTQIRMSLMQRVNVNRSDFCKCFKILLLFIIFFRISCCICLNRGPLTKIMNTITVADPVLL